jgi:hypothetical protein
LVRVPIRIEGQGQRSEAVFHYSIGSFLGRETTLPLQTGFETVLRFRIPLELFRSREHLIITVLESSSVEEEQRLWLKRWEITWEGKAPLLDPVAD